MKLIKIYVACILSLGICDKVSCQLGLPQRPYEQLQFLNLKYDWYQTIKADEMISDSCDGYNFITDHATAIVHDGKYISVTYTQWPTASFVGNLIEVRDVKDGHRLWHDLLEVQDYNRHEVVINFIVTNEGQKLDVYSLIQDRLFANNKSLELSYGTLDMHLKKRTYDLSTGLLEYETFPDFDDDRHLFSFGPFQSRAQIFQFANGKIKLFDEVNYYMIEKAYFEMHTLDDQANVVHKDSFYLKQWQYFPYLYQYDSVSYYFAEVKNQTKEIRFYKFNQDDELVDTLLFQQKSNMARTKCLGVNKHGFLLSTNPNYPAQENETRFLLIDHQGTIIRDNTVHPDRYQSFNLLPFYFDSENIYLFAGKRKTNVLEDTVQMSVLKSNSLGGYDEIKIISIENDRRYVGVDRVVFDKDNIYLLLNEIALENDNPIPTRDWGAWASSVVKLPLSELGINMTSTIAEKEPNNVSLYPSIATHDINLSFERGFKGDIIISNNLGQIIKKVSINEATTKQQIDVEGLSSGLYNIMLIERNMPTKTLRFIRN